ncbi:TadE family protein [Glaciimonas sp. PCH181]|uniref:TadE family protein n=1 Tax=Glaciimonas sp. PCH181 TaxID=2133943 RepID=UPI000D3DB034|nr:TadE family protein [Glaciimonas sp. PCH181]PUA19812.1 pilus assembly protein TadE [Glaciimonas sp. PCH181]
MVNDYTGGAINKVDTRKLVTRKTQRGIAAIEFALVFPIFFVLLYGIITYCLIFVVQQSLTLAAAEGARAALRYVAVPTVPTIPATPDPRGVTACNVAKQTVSWLDSSVVACVPSIIPNCYIPAAPAVAVACVKVTVSYPYSTNPLVPLLLGSLMSVAVPTTLGSSATVQLN